MFGSSASRDQRYPILSVRPDLPVPVFKLKNKTAFTSIAGVARHLGPRSKDRFYNRWTIKGENTVILAHLFASWICESKIAARSSHGIGPTPAAGATGTMPGGSVEPGRGGAKWRTH